jgi:hypothetical protein
VAPGEDGSERPAARSEVALAGDIEAPLVDDTGGVAPVEAAVLEHAEADTRSPPASVIEETIARFKYFPSQN